MTRAILFSKKTNPTSKI